MIEILDKSNYDCKNQHKNIVNIYEYLKTITQITFVNFVASTFLEFYRKSAKL